jgi:hypothetical protein
VASVTKKQIEDLKKAFGASSLGGCPVCRDVYVVGMPGLFASVYRGPQVLTSKGPTRGRSELLPHEEARRFLEGCPACGEDVPTYPIVMRGLGEHPPIADPWPVREWPKPLNVPGKMGNLYE